MGVAHLWSLLAPVGRRVDMGALRGKTVAVDASIWLVRFVKAMRDEPVHTTAEPRAFPLAFPH